MITLDPKQTYISALQCKLHFWFDYRDRLINELKVATDYERVATIQEEHKFALTKIDSIEEDIKELE